MRRLLCVALLAAPLALACGSETRAQGAQGFCPTSYEPAVTIAATRYDIKLEDGCKLLVFTASSAVAATLPDPSTTLPIGWKIGIKTEGAGTVTVSPLGGKLIDGGVNISLATGVGTGIRTDHINFFTSGLTGGGGGGGVTGVSIIGGPCITAIPNPIVTTGIIEFTIPASVPCGGTGDTTLGSHAVLLGEGTGPVSWALPSSTSGIPLISQGSAADPIFGTAEVRGGGTGQTAYTDGQLLIGNSIGNTLTKATLTAGSGVAIANGGGSITISSTGSGGSLTSVSAGACVTATPNPIITTGTIALTVPAVVSCGGTGQTSLTAHDVILGEGTSPVGLAAPGALNTILTSNGPSADPTFQAPPFDIVMFWPGVPPNSAIVRIALTRAASCVAGLTGSEGIAKAAATGSTVVTINQVTAGVTTARGTATWSPSATVAGFVAASPISFAAADIAEFAFPGSADATLADVAITLKCARA